MVTEPSALETIPRLQEGHLKKHIATVFIRGNLSSLERKLWNILTKNAYPRLSEEDRYEIPVSVLLRAANIHGNDRRILKPALIKLRQTSIHWIRQSKTGQIEVDADWAEFGFLSFVMVRDGMVYYEYTKFVREQLQDPSVYARIHLESQSKLPRGRALALYEITARYRPNKAKGFRGLTDSWNLEFFRMAMGAEAPLYDEFKNLNRRIIKANVEKINERTDIKLKPIFHRKGRRCVAVQFEVRDNPQLPLALDSENSESVRLRNELVRFGLGLVEADDFLKTYDVDYLQEKINYVEAQLKAGKQIEFVNAYLRKAILKDWKMVSGSEIRRLKRQETESLKREQLRIELEKEAQRDAEERAQKDAEQLKVDSHLASLSETERADLDTKFETQMKSNSISRQTWERREEGVYRLMLAGSWRAFVLEELDACSVAG